MKNNKFYVTTPIYYVNSKPHLGTLYSTLIADVAARWNKLLGKEVFFMTGLDEHGQKIGEAAEKKGMKPQDFVDSMVAPFKDMWERYELDFNHFIRTTDESHKEAVTFLIKKLIDKGDIYKSSYTGFYCTPCETFVPDAAVGKDKPVCPTCNRDVVEVSEESYFFRLSAYEDQILEFYENNPKFLVPKERINEVVSFVKSGLNDLSISRKSVSWGIPFPGDEEHTVYVWGDALTNYISGIGYGKSDADSQKEFEKWWPADLHVMAKDIVRFHAVYWPAFLIAADLPLPKRMLVHGYLLMGGEKMSKSKGNVLDPADLADWYGVEPVRYHLMRHTTISQDGHVSLEEIERSINADLSNNLGNLLNRTVALALKNDLKVVPPAQTLEADSARMKELCEEAFRDYWDNMNHYQYHVALADLWKFISEVNAFVHSQEPWKLAKENKELFGEVMSVVCHCLKTIGILLWPIMPKKMEKLLGSIGIDFKIYDHDFIEEMRKNNWNCTFKLTALDEPLFPRLESRLESE
jgi:methionyl-tRNA synthetase